MAILNKKKIVMFGSNLTSGSGDVFEANCDETLHDGQTSNDYKTSHRVFDSCKLEYSVPSLMLIFVFAF